VVDKRPGDPANRSIARPEHQSTSDADTAEADQTAADADQTASDTDQAASERDTDDAARDQEAADQDQRTSDRELDADADGPTRADHDNARKQRDESRRTRSATDAARRGTSLTRGATSTRRDEMAARRDEAARLRDAEAATLDALAGPSDPAVAEQFARLRMRAATDRARAAADRARAARDRAEAARERDRLERELHSAHLDDLTGAFRREAGALALSHEIDRARRADGRFVLAFVDVDGMKLVNDRDGHAAGDDVLRTLVATIRANLRSFDPVVRYGGDEFVCGLGGIDLADAESRFALIDLALHDATGVGVTVGLAALEPADSLDRVTARADAAMLAAKKRRPAVLLARAARDLSPWRDA
jgi:diguanylate cyclase (GGDEF)-like protein